MQTQRWERYVGRAGAACVYGFVYRYVLVFD